jgi:hypothetical protein
MNKFCIAMLIALVVPAVAQAGGGNSKSTGSITFKNTSTTNDVYVILDADLATTTSSNFLSRGGKVLSKGTSHTYGSLKSGKHTYAYASVAQGVSSPSPSAFTVKTVNVSGGQALNIDLK